VVLRAWGIVGPTNRADYFTKKIVTVATKLVKAITDTREGTFQPERENDELTRALGNAEHPGRTRGKGLVSWKTGFSECNDSYRSRDRKKKQDADRFQRLEKKNEEMEHILMRQQEQLDEIS
jgi:3-hydroxyacyl-CoA dehydrogenase